MSCFKDMESTPKPTVQCHLQQDNLTNLFNEPNMDVESRATLNKMTENKHYIFLLVGKTGSGRSAAGNSILGENYFVSGDKGSSTTRQISSKTVVRNELKVTVIDTPGIMDSSVSGAKSKACTELTAAMRECPSDGKLAIVMVLKYGERFTEENRQTIYILKSIFGDTNMWKSCIIIMTHGYFFQVNNEDGITFEGWARSQIDELGQSFKDCSYRCVLYNNRTNHPEERKRQFEKLIQLADLIDREYTMPQFLAAKTYQNRLLLEEKLPEIMKKYDLKIKDMIYSTNSLSVRDDKYVAFKNSVKMVREELSAIDNQGLIYYAREEMLLLNEQRIDLNYLEEDVEIRVTLNGFEKKAQDLDNTHILPSATQLNHFERTEILYISKQLNDLESSIEDLENQIDRKTEFLKYKNRIHLLQEKLNSLKLEIKRRQTRDCYDLKIKKLTEEINHVPVSTALDILPPYFAHVDRLSMEISALEKELGGFSFNSVLETLKKNIQSKIQESSFTKIRNVSIAWCVIFTALLVIIVAIILIKIG